MVFFLFLLYYYMYKCLYCVRGDASIASCFLVNKYMIYSDILKGGRVVGTCTYRCICCWNTSFTSLQFPNLPKNSCLDLSECINKLAVCFLLGAESELVSGSSDKLVIVWKKTASQDCKVSYMFVVNICSKLLCSWASENGGLVVWSGWQVKKPLASQWSC